MAIPTPRAITLVGKIAILDKYEEYDGEYSVVPGMEEQVLETEDKHLSENIIVAPIPYEEIPNAAGGYTIVIGGGADA